MAAILNFLKGKKTYLLALATVGFGVYNHFWGLHLPWEDVMPFIFGGSGFATVRAAIDKVIP